MLFSQIYGMVTLQIFVAVSVHYVDTKFVFL